MEPKNYIVTRIDGEYAYIKDEETYDKILNLAKECRRHLEETGEVLSL